MTLLHYTLADAQQWAAFSGDENPIHFDLAAARQMGAGQLSVHGMRALLDVKRDAHSRLYRPERYVKCQVRLRRPIWCDTDWLLTPGLAKNRLLSATSVSNPQNGELCLSCQMSTAAEPESLVGKQPCTIAPKTLRELQSCFNAAWPDLAQWQFLDALLFRQLIGDPALLRQESIASLLGPGKPRCSKYLPAIRCCKPTRRWCLMLVSRAKRRRFGPNLWRSGCCPRWWWARPNRGRWCASPRRRSWMT